jgi:hypothetical protein
LRSINPIIKGNKLFEFKLIDYYEQRKRYDFCTEWTQDPHAEENSNLINEIFDFQLLQKKEKPALDLLDKEFSGEILVAEIDNTIWDGASEQCSEGLVDVYDLPPIDTWFYIKQGSSTRNLYAWIPKEFIYQANDAISVNAVDCLSWLGKLPIDFLNYTKEKPFYLIEDPKKSFAQKIINFFK